MKSTVHSELLQNGGPVGLIFLLQNGGPGVNFLLHNRFRVGMGILGMGPHGPLISQAQWGSPLPAHLPAQSPPTSFPEQFDTLAKGTNEASLDAHE